MQVKKIIAGVVAVGLSTVIAASAVAAQPGAYVGGQLGYGNVHEKTDDKGVAGRIFTGYQFNNNFAGELGWSKFHNAESSTNYSGYSNQMPVNSKDKVTLKTDVVDLVAKATYPVAEGVNVFGKLGGAYAIQRANTKVTTTSYSRGGAIVATASTDQTIKRLLPTASIGVGYDFTQNVVADVSYTRIQKVGNSPVNSIDFAGVGLTYNFG
jgi:opacity protein-like surface antigen